MTLAAITAAVNLLTLGILVAGAVIATIQFGHIRAGNALQSILAVERSLNEPELRRALVYVQTELPERLTQPQYRLELAALGYIDPGAHPEMIVCNWFDETGSLVEGGFLGEAIFFDSFGRLVEHYWQLLAPAIGVLRRARGAEQYANFAGLAYRAQRWREQGRAAPYPRGVPRMPLSDPWAQADGAARIAPPQR